MIISPAPHLHPAGLRRLDRAKACGFAVRDSAESHRAEVAYRSWCHAQRRPFVHVVRRTSTAVVSLSMSPAGYRLDARSMDLIKPLLGSGFSYAGDDAKGYEWVHFGKVPIACAETVAFRAYEIALDCRPSGGAVR